VEDDVLENRYSSSFEGGPGINIANDIIVSEEVVTSGADRYYLDDEVPVSISSIDKPFTAASITAGGGQKQTYNRARPLSSALMRPGTASAKSTNRQHVIDEANEVLN
jgi:hypothetical protein